jgi:hypothetical protein
VQSHPRSLGRRQGIKKRIGRGGRADGHERQVRIGGQGLQSAVNHDGGGVIPAEEVNGDPRGD